MWSTNLSLRRHKTNKIDYLLVVFVMADNKELGALSFHDHSKISGYDKLYFSSRTLSTNTRGLADSLLPELFFDLHVPY